MIDFPPNPTIGSQFTAAGVTWTWDGAKWAANGLQQPYLPLAGGTMAGPIVLAADPVAALQPATKQYVDGGRLGENRIINGDMRIDQRNAGASGTVGGYTTDRWNYSGMGGGLVTWQRVPVGCPGFPYALRMTSNTARVLAATDTFYVLQPVEADMVSDFGWGTANAQPVTLSFWVYCTLTGTFGGCVANYAGMRSYPFTYTINAANTWEKKTIAIPGDTAGTWVMAGNGGAVNLFFDLGSGANYRGPAGAWTAGNLVGANGAVSVVAVNGATFYLTGVKLEIGSVATPFNRQSLAKSLADCQRYYNTGTMLVIGYQLASANIGANAFFPATMRASPTITPARVGAINMNGTYNATNIWVGGYIDVGQLTAAGSGQYMVNYTANAEL
jgi:hypothetical protein